MGRARWRCRSFVEGPVGWSAGCGLLLLSLITGPAWADGVNVDTELSYNNDSNVKRAQSGPDVVSDRALALGVNLGGALPVSGHTRLVSRAFVRGERFSSYDKLSNVSAGASANFQYRSSGHLLTPTYGAFIKISVTEFRSEIRNSTFYSGGLSVSKNLTDRVLASAILSGTVRDSDSKVFDTREGSALLNLDYQLRGGSAWYVSYNFLTGDTVSSGTPTLQIVDAAKAIVADDAFGGAAANQFAYRIHANTHVATLGFNLPIARRHALDLSVRYAHADADNNLTYDRTLYSLAYLARF